MKRILGRNGTGHRTCVPPYPASSPRTADIANKQAPIRPAKVNIPRSSTRITSINNYLIQNAIFRTQQKIGRDHVSQVAGMTTISKNSYGGRSRLLIGVENKVRGARVWAGPRRKSSYRNKNPWATIQFLIFPNYVLDWLIAMVPRSLSIYFTLLIWSVRSEWCRNHNQCKGGCLRADSR